MDGFTIDRPSRQYHLLSVNKTQAYIHTKSLSLEEMMRNLPDVREDKILNKMLLKGNDKDKGQSFDRSKVQGLNGVNM